MTASYDTSAPGGAAPTGDPRLNRVLLLQPQMCASVNEYASATGVDVKDVIDQFGPLLETGGVQLEIAGDEMFMLTGPQATSGQMSLPANLWRILRERADPAQAYMLWQLIRGLQRAGWNVHHDLRQIMAGLSSLANPPQLGVDVAGRSVPVLILPPPDALCAEHGVLSQYRLAGAVAVAVVCDNGALDQMVTATRRWFLSHGAAHPDMAVLLLEAPQFMPTLLSGADGAIRPVSVSHRTVQTMGWSGRPAG